MKGYRTAVIAAALMMAISTIAAAQGGGGGGRGGQRGGRGGGRAGNAFFSWTPEVQADSLLSGITVSADNKTKIVGILKTFDEFRTQNMPQRGGGGGGGDPQAMQETMAKITQAQTKRDTDIKALLSNDADKKKYDENVAKFNPTRGGRRGGGR